MRAAALVFAAALAGCASTTASDARQAELCADQGLRWLARPAGYDRLLVLGIVRDPASSGGRLVPSDPYNEFGMPGLLWLKATEQLYFYVSPRERSSTTFAPEPSEPEGVYRLTVVPAPDPLCARYDAHLAELSRVVGPDRVTPAPHGACVRYDYVGPLDVAAYNYISLTYVSEQSAVPGTRRVVHELVRPDGEVLARGIQYFPRDGGDACATPPPYYPEQSLQRPE